MLFFSIKELHKNYVSKQRLFPPFLFVVRTTFSEFSSKAAKDPRFKLIDKAREKEGMFNEFMIEYRKSLKERTMVENKKVSCLFSFV